MKCFGRAIPLSKLPKFANTENLDNDSVLSDALAQHEEKLQGSERQLHLPRQCTVWLHIQRRAPILVTKRGVPKESRTVVYESERWSKTRVSL